jgi:hypothetical protein
VKCEAGGIPGVTADNGSAEELDVVIGAAQEQLVEWLLGRPHRRGDCARDGSPQSSGANGRGGQDRQL